MQKRVKYIRSKASKDKRKGFKQTSDKRKEMMNAWLHRQSINYVSQRCKVSRQTCNRYRELDQWDTEHDKMMKRVKKKVTTQSVNRTARNIVALDLAIDNITKQIKKKKTKVAPIILHQLVKTQDDLLRRNPEQDQGDIELPDEVTEALKVLADMDKKEVKALGDLVVKELMKEGT